MLLHSKEHDRSVELIVCRVQTATVRSASNTTGLAWYVAEAGKHSMEHIHKELCVETVAGGDLCGKNIY
jgi:hypothetical protein